MRPGNVTNVLQGFPPEFSRSTQLLWQGCSIYMSVICFVYYKPSRGMQTFRPGAVGKALLFPQPRSCRSFLVGSILAGNPSSKTAHHPGHLSSRFSASMDAASDTWQELWNSLQSIFLDKSILVDMVEEIDSYHFFAEIPGVAKKDLQVRLTKLTRTLEAALVPFNLHDTIHTIHMCFGSWLADQDSGWVPSSFMPS